MSAKKAGITFNHQIASKMKTLAQLALLILGGIAISCESEVPQASLRADLELPASPYYYGQFVNSDQATLGRVLFYDRQLSINNSISCASCHKQSLAFADNVAKSVGFAGKMTTRNSMPIQNLGFDGLVFLSKEEDTLLIDRGPIVEKSLFWDGREKVLSTMVIRPIVNHVEMGITDLESLNKKLASISYYRPLFEKAFGSSDVSTDKVGMALQAFLHSINSNNTRFDLAQRGELLLSSLEQKGSELFMSKYDCNSCHQVGSPNGYIFAGTFANIGLDEDYQDEGLARVTNQAQDDGKFKIPSLRNVALTAPYMHDGRFATLDEVVEHYSEGIADNENLDARLRRLDGTPQRFNIPAEDRAALIAFLKTLTDESMLRDERFADPFKIH